MDLQLLERHGDLIGVEGELDRFEQRSRPEGRAALSPF